MVEIEASATNAPEITVSELSSAIKRAIEDRFGYVRVRGEISGYRGPHTSGHAYFSLKDANARLDAVIWRGVFARMRVKPEEGLEVVAIGKLTTFPGKSSYQIVVEALEPAGVGALMALLEARKRKFAEEGLFDAARKRPLPYLPRTVGVVTSPTGAVIRDIIHRLSDRFPLHVLVWPVRVQGETCGAEVAAAIEGFNALGPAGPIPRPDVLIVARGGGSLEDLWGFNEEAVVRAAAKSAIPLIAAVGHETDWTLIDYVADLRAPTPTAAAELVAPVRAELLASLAELDGRGRGAMLRLAQRRRADLRALARALPNGEALLATPRQRLDRAGESLKARAIGALHARALRIAGLAGRLARQSPFARASGLRERINGLGLRLARVGGALTQRSRQSLDLAATALRREARAQNKRRGESFENLRRRLGALRLARRRQSDERMQVLAGLAARLRRNIGLNLDRRRVRLAAAAQVFGAVGYRNVLARGFALVRDSSGAPLRRAADIAAGQALAIEFADGVAAATADGDGPTPRTAAETPTRTRRPRAGKQALDQGSLF